MCEVTGVFAKAVQEQYGGLENLKTSVNAAAMKIQGSGWVWLVSPLEKGVGCTARWDKKDRGQELIECFDLKIGCR